MNGVDMLYLKNVLLKFVEAHALGRLAEVAASWPSPASRSMQMIPWLPACN